MKKLWGMPAIILALTLTVIPSAADQYSLTVANGTGQQVRTGFNNAMKALATIQSGPSAPTTTYPYMHWVNTTTGKEQIRNAADTDWITIFDLATGNAVNGVPVGAVQMWTTGTAPSGWLLCYGQAVSRTTYAALFAVIGTTFGTGDGSTTFNLPDLRGRMLIGLDNMGGSAASRVAAATSIGQAAGTETHSHTGPSHTHTTGDCTLTAAQSGLPAHAHNISTTDNGGAPKNRALGGTANNQTNVGTENCSAANASEAHNHGATGSSGTGSTSTNSDMNPYMALCAIIKYN